MRGYRISTPQLLGSHDSGMFGTNRGFDNKKGDEVIAKHPEIAQTLKKIYDATQHPSVQTGLSAGFTRSDQTESG